MSHENILVTGGAGFLGSAVALRLREVYPQAAIVAADNLRRRGSELNVARLDEAGVAFLHADVRHVEDFGSKRFDLIIECSAEPSVMAGLQDDTDYVIDTNLGGALNCLQIARRHRSALLFISSSRVYPYDRLNSLSLVVEQNRFELNADVPLPPGVTSKGLDLDFPLSGRRTLYGATKLAAELFVQEYSAAFGIASLILRLGVIAGPWQMGKLDQGFVALWTAKHLANRPLTYTGYGGHGHQVRDVLHIQDAVDLIVKSTAWISSYRGEVFNAGGGPSHAVSLAQTTALCQQITGNKIEFGSSPDNRPGDIPWYISDNSKVSATFEWEPQRSVSTVIQDTADWLKAHPKVLEALSK